MVPKLHGSDTALKPSKICLGEWTSLLIRSRVKRNAKMTNGLGN